MFAETIPRRTPGRRRRKKVHCGTVIKYVTVRILEINASAAIPVVELGRPPGSRERCRMKGQLY